MTAKIEWVVDDGSVLMEDQAHQLINGEGTGRQWCAVGINDNDGFAEVVALCHPLNAPLIAAAPELLAALESLASSFETCLHSGTSGKTWREVAEINLKFTRAAIAKAQRAD